MTPVITAVTLNRVNQAADRGDNPLGLGVGGDETSTSKRIITALQDLGEHRDAVAASLQNMAADDDRYSDDIRHIDEVTAKLIAHIGLEPLMVAWLSALGDGVTILDEEMSDIVVIDANADPHDGQSCRSMVNLSAHVTWHSCGIVSVLHLPDTITIGSVAKRLSRIISHPVLDAYDFNIARANVYASDKPSELEVGMFHVYPDFATLADMRPNQ